MDMNPELGKVCFPKDISFLRDVSVSDISYYSKMFPLSQSNILVFDILPRLRLNAQIAPYCIFSLISFTPSCFLLLLPCSLCHNLSPV